MKSSFGLAMVLLAAATLLVTLSFVSAGQENAEPKDFNELLSLANKLESAKFVLHRMSDSQLKERAPNVYRFVRAIKSPFCDKKYEDSLKVARDYKIKAYELIKENKKTNKNWFSNTLGNAFGPISKLRGISKSDAYLSDITKQYDGLSKQSLLTEQKVDCDVNKYKVKTLHEILFIIQAEVKYLITEQANVVNRAIYDRLKADQFVSMSNFYDTHDFNDAQRKLVLEFLSHREDQSKMTVGQAEDRFYSPGDFVVGRLLETCQVLDGYNDKLTMSSKENEKLCTDSSTDPLSSLFAVQFKPDRFESTTSFCDQLLAAL